MYTMRTILMQQNEMYYSLLEGYVSKADFDDWLEAYVCERTTAALQDALSPITAYSEELHLHSPMTLEQLISSHRSMRRLSLEYSTAKQQGYADAYKAIQEQNKLKRMVSVDSLRGATVEEIVEIINGNGE